MKKVRIVSYVQRRVAAWTMLMLLLVNVLVFGFGIRSAGSSGKTYNRVGGLADVPTAPTQQDKNVYALGTALRVHNVNTGLNYTTIQAAIDASDTLDGHMLCCDAGIYYEHVIINKSLTLQGEDQRTTIVDGNGTGNVVNATVNNVKVTGFTIQNSGIYPNDCGVGLENSGSCSIIGNIIQNTTYGIWVYMSEASKVVGNAVMNNKNVGIGVYFSDDCVVADNTVTNDGVHGIWVWSNNCTVTGNMVNDNDVGIMLRQSENCTVSGNIVVSNRNYGIETVSNESHDNAICNNFFNNTNNAFGYGVDYWNTTKQAGSNMIGGSCIGGNYWSDNPNPVDADNDGIGDVSYNVAGGANNDYLPLVTQLPIVVASFMTPEGEPYMFDDVRISNGTWMRRITNVTHMVAQMPVNVTFAVAYTFGDHREMYEFPLRLSLHDVRSFEFYALDPYTVLGRVRPYLIGRETGTTVNLTWQYFDFNKTLTYKAGGEPAGRYLLLCTWTRAPNDIPQRNPGSSRYAGPPKSPEEIYVTWGQQRYGNWILVQDCTNGVDQYISKETGVTTNFHTINIPQIVVTPTPPSPEAPVSLVYERINNTYLRPVGVRKVLDNHARMDEYALRLCTLNGTSFDPQYFYPQWAVPVGGYILELYNLPKDYAPLGYPLSVSGAEDVLVFDPYPPKIEDLKPYAFSTAGEDFFAESSYSNLTNDIVMKSLSVTVSTKTKDNWWGCFVLPRSQTVEALTAYSGSASYPLSRFYNYTENLVGDYNIIVVRIPPEIDHLNLTYTASQDVTVNDVAPSKTVVGQGFSTDINVTVANQGSYTATFDITVYANTTSIASQGITLSSGNSTTIIFTWNTAGFAKGNYTISAYATPVPYETDTSDNLFTDEQVSVTMVGDINADGKVDIKDVYKVAQQYGKTMPPDLPSWDPIWGPICDINNDKKVDIKDYYILYKHYGETDP